MTTQFKPLGRDAGGLDLGSFSLSFKIDFRGLYKISFYKEN